MEAIFFLINAVVSFFTTMFMLRFLMQMTRTSFSGQIGDFVVKLTNWAVKPLRRIVPGVGGVDWASLLAALWLQLLMAGIIIAASSTTATLSADGVGMALMILMFAVRGLLRLTVYIMIGAIILQAVLSWINPYSPVAPLVNQLVRPLLDPIRRFVPTISGIDLSPLVAILLLQVVLMFL
ncbi:MAG: YggT family protein [Betaproteobacteria bacterium HGW-Betaproteobacteria-7]|jgi:YggT family protein|nr:MAG: YggT family protein [Betaproteobacteria bacterium HGW-Betaproteobacteria-7]